MAVPAPDHSVTTWVYSVSQTVASFAITGALGFVVVKKLRLQERKLEDVPWGEFGDTGTAIFTGMLMVMLLVTAISNDDLSGTVWWIVALPLLSVVAHYAGIRLKKAVVRRRKRRATE